MAKKTTIAITLFVAMLFALAAMACSDEGEGVGEG